MANTEKKDNNKRDKLSAGPYVTGSFGTSTSSNLTIASSGAYDDPSEFFPHNNIDNKKQK